MKTQPVQHSFSKIFIIVPCYNPPPGWETALTERFFNLKKTVAELPVELHLAAVNDGSTRNVGAENFQNLKKLAPGAVVVDYPENRGKGHALRQGVAAVEADFYVVTDADFPYTLLSMRRVIEMLLAHGGVVAGNRDLGYYQSVPFFRKMLSQTLRWLLRNVIRLPVTDSQCGLKGFDNAGKAVFLKTKIERFLFDLEFLMLASGKVPVTPAPVELREGVVFSKVGWKILATEGRNFLFLFLKNLLRG